jgi:hypothetical protein
MGNKQSPPQYIVMNTPASRKVGTAYCVFMIIMSVVILATSAINLYYIEKTKDSVTNPDVTSTIIEASQAGMAINFIVSILVIVSFSLYLRLWR